MPYSLLFVVGSDETNDLLIPALKQEFRIEVCRTAEGALVHLRSMSFDLAVLESELPDMSGLTLFKILREMDTGKQMPVIFLSACKTEQSLSDAFRLGADDYISVPYEPREISARIRAVIRRKHETMEDWGGMLSVSGIQIDPSQRSCIVKGKRIYLASLEFELLKVLMRKAGRVLTRPYLLSVIWDMNCVIDTRAVDAAVSRLRRALGRRYGKLIETVSKMGYCFNEQEKNS